MRDLLESSEIPFATAKFARRAAAFAHILLILAGCDERRPCRGALPRLSQETIAEMVGTTRSRVNGFIGKFKKTGFIEQVGGVLCPHVRGGGARVAAHLEASRWLRTG